MKVCLSVEHGAARSGVIEEMTKKEVLQLLERELTDDAEKVNVEIKERCVCDDTHRE